MNTHILYLTPDLSDPTTHKRVTMLKDGGAKVTLAGFRRSERPVREVAGCPATDLGRTFNGGFVQRMRMVIWHWLHSESIRRLAANADVILARNLEMLALGTRARHSNMPLTYECLDIHRLLLRQDMIGAALRRLEGWLASHAIVLITSSPAFVSDYFQKLSKVRLPVRLVENKVYQPHAASLSTMPRHPGPPWRIGWFGAIRCHKSLEVLSTLAHESNGLVEVIIRGKVAYDQLKDFDETIRQTPGLRFLGPYKNPEELAEIYHEVHFTWAIDMFEEGLNSAWLLPNRIYEGGVHNAVPIAQASVETGRFLKQLCIGVLLEIVDAQELLRFFNALTPEAYQRLEAAAMKVDRAIWTYDKSDCEALVHALREARAA